MRILMRAVRNTFLAQLGVAIPASEKRKGEIRKVTGKPSIDTVKKPINYILLMFKHSSAPSKKQVFIYNYVNKPSYIEKCNQIGG